MKIHEMLKYAYHHGVSTLALENPEILGRLKLFWIRNGDRRHRSYNWKATIFRSRIVEKTTSKAQLYGLNVEFVEPRGTSSSREHDEIMKKYGLDRHMASAYLIALRSIQK